MVAEKVSFKVSTKGRKDGRAVGHGTLKKMGLIQTDATTPSSIFTLRPRPSRAHFASVKSTMMRLLHTLVCKALRFLKNQKTFSSNQRKLVTCHNADRPEHSIELESINYSDSDAELEDEEAFNVLAPQFQEDPHSEDEDAAIGGISSGDDEEEESGEDDDEDEEDNNDWDADQGDEGRKREEEDEEDPEYMGN